jgi:hypothetical protein
VAELLREEAAVRDERLGVRPVDGVEDLVHGHGEQVELVDEHHQLVLAPSTGRRSA